MAGSGQSSSSSDRESSVLDLERAEFDDEGVAGRLDLADDRDVLFNALKSLRENDRTDDEREFGLSDRLFGGAAGVDLPESLKLGGARSNGNLFTPF